ncbi:cbb3-type cytochrome c oxidase subunit II [Telmatobacter sp. DSM 110680]|uniref:Cbb3-type cytochrome c oxidase subunit II n=1 Tax=Telmatobacter sp. DSM 110680 TaxID=3036704 RepID=A0AAU7DKI5_9BACT
MLLAKLRKSGVQGVGLIAVTYVYFLIFAQFAFIHRLDALGITGAHLKSVMAAMAVGGILLSLLAPRVSSLASASRRMQLAFCVTGIAALLTLVPLTVTAAIAVSFLIGAGLGLLTVTLVTNLRQWTGDRSALLKVGIGTGIGYFLCNIPSLFTASPQAQSATAGLLCLVGIVVANLTIEPISDPVLSEPSLLTNSSIIPFVLVVASFAALIWLDSAAFFIIQNTTVLKAGTWQGSAHLWANGLIHLGAALLSAFLLRRRGLSIVLAVAVGALAFACLLLLDPARALTASVFYPIGVSLYSVALVAYPSLLSSATSPAQRGRQAGWIYAIAGWIGSALGIGMGQNLGHVPPAFVAVASAVVLFPVLVHIFRHRPRELALTAVVLLIALVVYRVQPSAPVAASPTAVERGRLVYISEGCIHCHSQYVRPNTADVIMWGPVESVDQVHQQRPPLIGNRRQGPDLMQVGARRSALWLKMHLFDPRQVSGSSIMPSYAFLFQDRRGNDLVAYLASLQNPAAQQHIADEQQWHLPAKAVAAAIPADGQQLYNRYCATCHNADGRTRIKWQSEFTESPAILTTGATTAGSSTGSQSARIDHLAQIIKFGVPNSDMAGHEYLPDKDIASLSTWLAQNTPRPAQKQ